ncbi:glycosyltransferase involved in cell wall biosynthesis [Nonomuraea thailandensis]|uniref:Glycosyltransferase involved in cell wall biosynthesis n=1 Tax=Nonomuraea thailandensis TaxID=1188745 RepID=A0A9X2GSD2_9ACTN|nr:glycosyltransferase [Nonomuraea thailandensis]MCP2362897.1 glycosyltransferase involved in cell wall biosynthesis [Nonomuraea thailandensis]
MTFRLLASLAGSPRGGHPIDPAEDERRPLRLLIGTDTYPPDVNGTACATYRLAGALVTRGHDVHVVCPSEQGPPRVERAGGVTVHRLRSVAGPVRPDRRIIMPVLLTGTLARMLRRIAPDVVHVQDHFVVGRALIDAARRLCVPVVATTRFLPHAGRHVPGTAVCDLGKALAWRDLARVFGRADHVAAPSRAAAELLAGRGLNRPVEPVPYGVDLTRFRPREEPKTWARGTLGLPDRETALFVGRLDAGTRLDELLRALRQVCRSADAQLVLVGDGPRRGRLERLAGALGLGGRTHFLGSVPEDVLHLAYASADVFAMPKVAGLDSAATLEAMASGLPVVAAEAGARTCLVQHGTTGFLYRPGEVPAFARFLTRVLTDGELAATMGTIGRTVAATHDHLRSLSRIEEIYAGLAQTYGGRVQRLV